MNLKEIVNRPNGITLEQDEALFILKEYIKIRKDVDVILRNEYCKKCKKYTLQMIVTFDY